MKKIIAFLVAFSFLASCVMPPQGWAQSLSAMDLMPQPGTPVALTPAFTPAHLKGMVIHPNDPFRFDFLVSRGDEQLGEEQKQAEYQKLIKYFLASLAVPDKEQWVNLSPYEQERIIPENFGMTEMGRDLLAQDYLLKQISATLTSPDTDLGRKFWDGVYAKAYEKFGTTDVPTDAISKVWVTPDKAVVFEKGNAVVVLEHHLKVQMESDYVAMKENGLPSEKGGDSEAVAISKQVMREIIIPALEKEVNEGQSFAPVRQVFSGMLLATWYKKALKESILGRLYADQNKVKGVDQDPATNQRIYEQYVEAFRKGVFNMIREDVDRYSREVLPRKYFSGGMGNDHAAVLTVDHSEKAEQQAGNIMDREGLDSVQTILRDALQYYMNTRAEQAPKPESLPDDAATSGNGIQNDYKQSRYRDEQAKNVRALGFVGRMTRRVKTGAVALATLTTMTAGIWGLATIANKADIEATRDRILNSTPEVFLKDVNGWEGSVYSDKYDLVYSFKVTDKEMSTLGGPQGAANLYAQTILGLKGYTVTVTSINTAPAKGEKKYEEMERVLSEALTNPEAKDHVWVNKVPGGYVIRYMKAKPTKPADPAQASPSTDWEEASSLVVLAAVGALGLDTLYLLFNGDADMTIVSFLGAGIAVQLRALYKKYIKGRFKAEEDKIRDAASNEKDALDNAAYGGFDFAQSNLDLQIRRDGAGVPLPVSQQDLENIRIDGLIPQILSIRPAAGMRIF